MSSNLKKKLEFVIILDNMISEVRKLTEVTGYDINMLLYFQEQLFKPTFCWCKVKVVIKVVSSVFLRILKYLILGFLYALYIYIKMI